jgi:hypothetical protein
MGLKGSKAPVGEVSRSRQNHPIEHQDSPFIRRSQSGASQSVDGFAPDRFHVRPCTIR